MLSIDANDNYLCNLAIAFISGDKDRILSTWTQTLDISIGGLVLDKGFLLTLVK